MKKLVWASVATFAVLACPWFIPTAKAQCGSRQYGSRQFYTYPTTYQYPVKEVVIQEVVTPVALPVLIPSFQFQYVAPCSAPAAAPGAVGVAVGGAPVVNPVAAATASPYGAALPMPGVTQTPLPQMQQMASAPGNGSSEQERVRVLAKALLSEMNKQVDDGPPTATGDVLGQQMQQTQPSYQQTQQPWQQQPQTQPQAQQQSWLSVLNNRCAMCHTGRESKGGVQLFSSPGAFNSSVDWQRVFRAVDEGRMPLNPQTRQPYQLPLEEKALVHQAPVSN